MKHETDHIIIIIHIAQVKYHENSYTFESKLSLIH